MNDTLLSPWDRIPAFAMPVESSFFLTGAPQLVARADPMRVLLVFGIGGISNSSTTITYPIPIAFGTVSITSAIPNAIVSTNPNVASTSGFVINPVMTPLILDVKQWGAAVAAPWYALGGGSGPPLTVLTLSMLDWPESPQLGSTLIQDADNGKWRGLYARRANSPGRTKLYGNRWTQRQAVSPYDLPDLD